MIELLIVLAIVAIIATFAVGNYSGVIVKIDRATAKADLNKIAQALERYQSTNRTYTNDFAILGLGGNVGNTTTLTSADSKYTYAITATTTTPNIYLITSSPLPLLTKDTWHLQLDHLGQQTHCINAATCAPPIIGW